MNRKKQNRPNNLHTPRKDVFLRRALRCMPRVISACLPGHARAGCHHRPLAVIAI